MTSGEPIVAARDLNLRIPAGECYGLLGPNGAGQTVTSSFPLARARDSNPRPLVPKARSGHLVRLDWNRCGPLQTG